VKILAYYGLLSSYYLLVSSLVLTIFPARDCSLTHDFALINHLLSTDFVQGSSPCLTDDLVYGGQFNNLPAKQDVVGNILAVEE
jgi:hypothetical protein